jgi:predicted PurR-regulated permease PerM
MHTNSNEKYFLLILLSAVMILTLIIFYPFISVIIFSLVFAVALSPVYNWINTRFAKNIPWLSSLLTLIIFLVVLCIPLFFIATIVFNQTQTAYHSIVTDGTANVFIEKINVSINNVMPKGFTFDTYGKVMELVSFVSFNIAGFFTATFNSFVLFLVMILTIFYLLKDGSQWKKNFVLNSPFSHENTEEMLSKLAPVINQILKGFFFIAIIQGTLASIGFMIFNVPSPALWGVVAGLASLIPTIGTSIVLVPAIIFLYATGALQSALGLLLWSMVLVGIIDNMLGPYVISKNTAVAPLFNLFSILGGIALMGPAGILIGPLTLNFLYVLILLYKKESKINT